MRLRDAVACRLKRLSISTTNHIFKHDSRYSAGITNKSYLKTSPALLKLLFVGFSTNPNIRSPTKHKPTVTAIISSLVIALSLPCLEVDMQTFSKHGMI